jgi:DNA-binding transcriptional regulator LsrR (DeoR family)
VNLSITHVNRLLKEAQNQGIVKVIIRAPRREDLESRIKEEFALRDVRIIPTPESEQSIRLELGIAAANYFDQHLSDCRTVGLGSGRTLFEMVSRISEKPRQQVFYPIAIPAQQAAEIQGIDANIIVNIMWFKSRPMARAYRCELFFPEQSFSQVEASTSSVSETPYVQQLLRDISDLDSYLFSCSPVRLDSQLTSLAMSKGHKANEFEAKGIIGDYVFNTIGAFGEPISAGVESALFRVSLQQLRANAQDQRKKVVLIAGGKAKRSVITAGLRAQLFNTLITDQESAEEILRTN